jgi:carbon storage regulator
MLVLSRKLNEEIVIGRSIRVRLLKAGRGRVSLGVSAPKETPVHRAELIETESRVCGSTSRRAHYGRPAIDGGG